MSEPTIPLYPPVEWQQSEDVWVLPPPKQRLWLHAVLFIATIFTTTLFGAHIQANFEKHLAAFFVEDDIAGFPRAIWHDPSLILSGLPFSMTLMFILFAHEMGHYLYARHYRVNATLPFFIPFPSLIGTLGAFIRIRSPIRSRAALFDIGIAGPIAGFIPACIAVFIGLSHSVPLVVTDDPLNVQPGSPMLFEMCARLLHLHGSVSSFALHPIAVAGWVGLFATALNLLPGGQLDGGHIFYAVLPKLHRWATLITIFSLLLMSRYFFWFWIIWAAVLWLTSRHPLVPVRPLISVGRKWLAILAIGMLVVSFTPAPFTHSDARDVWPDIRDWGRQRIHSMSDRVHHWMK